MSTYHFQAFIFNLNKYFFFVCLFIWRMKFIFSCHLYMSLLSEVFLSFFGGSSSQSICFTPHICYFMGHVVLMARYFVNQTFSHNNLKQTSNLISYSKISLFFLFPFYIRFLYLVFYLLSFLRTFNLWFQICFPILKGVLSDSVVFHLRCGLGYHSDITMFISVLSFLLFFFSFPFQINSVVEYMLTLPCFSLKFSYKCAIL